MKSSLPQPAKIVEFKQTGGQMLSLYVFLPEDWKAADRRPAIIFWHGGGFTGGRTSQFYWQSEYLASRGMVCFNAEYRLRPKPMKVADMVRDANSAVRWVRAHAAEFGVDTDRIVSSGGSAGGHLAAATAVAKDLDEEGEDLSVSSRPNLLLLFNPALFHGLAQHVIEIEDFTRDTPPMIQLYGTNDGMLRYGELCMQSAAGAGNVMEIYVAEGQGHGFFNDSPWRECTIYAMDEFLAAHDYVEGTPTAKVEEGIEVVPYE